MTPTWHDLGALTLARQFPLDVTTEPTADDVATLVARTGPIQAQAARAPFLGIAARLPGVSHEQVTAAYERAEIVRGSNLRGTVHTSTAGQHRLLEAATRIGQRGLWRRLLALQHIELETVWTALEDFAAEEWRSVDELYARLLEVLAEHREDATAERLRTQMARYLAFGHGGLVRRPLKGGWETQTAAGYRAAWAVLGQRPAERHRAVTAPETLDDLVREHLRAHGPASRNDLSWWSGLGLRAVDDVLARLDLTSQPGPDGRTYVDLPGAPPPRTLPGVRLLPEFDALMCGYDPKARERFIAPNHHRTLWSSANGMVLPPLLVDGRISGFWRASGTGADRDLEVGWFARTRRPRKAELDEPVAALATVMGWKMGSVSLERHAG